MNNKDKNKDKENLNIEQKKQIIKEFKRRFDVSGVAKILNCSVQVFWNAIDKEAGSRYTDMEMRFIQAMYEKMLERQQLMSEVGVCNYNNVSPC